MFLLLQLTHCRRVKIVKNPGNGRLNNLNDPVLNVLTGDWLHDNVPTLMNKSESLSIEGKVRVIKYIVKWKEES